MGQKGLSGKMNMQEEIRTALHQRAEQVTAALGAPAVILGPGSIEQAHQIDEFVTCSQLHEAAELYIRIFTELFDEGGV